jgi:cytochrome c oxidase subunit 2
MGLGIYTVFQYVDVVEEVDGEKVIKVTALQWAWSFEYPDNPATEEPDGFVSNELVLLNGEPVRLEMRSLDVIHSFWVPEFKVKQDVVPGVQTVYRVTPILEGDYSLRCTEICGLNHSDMLAAVRVVNQGTYDDWVERKLAESQDPVLAGETLYLTSGCKTCHTIDGSRSVGPTWDNLYGEEVKLDDGSTVVADDEYIRTSILNPNAQITQGYAAGLMPEDYRVKLTDVQIEQITAYIASLAEDAAEPAPAEGSSTEGATPGSEPTPTEPTGNQ